MRIGIDLGGTKIEALLLDAAGIERLRRRVDTPQGDYKATLDSIAVLVAEAETVAGEPCSVGLGTPGALSPASGRLRNSNSTCLNGRAFKHDLEARLGRTVRLQNDANCFALSEASDGAAAGEGVVFGVILGTGVGGGMVVNGRVLTGRNAIAGEWGHNPLPWPQGAELPGPACYCGQRGCIETWLSGPGLAADHARYSDQLLAPAEIVARAAAGDARCEASLRRYEQRLARALASLINVLDPDVIVLGGGMSNITRLYRNVPVLLPHWVFSDAVLTRIVPPLHGDASGVRGAAWLWPA
jgi:fructokinase